MVKITGYSFRESNEGKPFYALTLQGGIEVVKSSNGGSYVTIRKCSLPTTFDEETCKSLIGQELPGSIQKIACDPYEYTIQQTGEVITLSYRFEYVNEEAPTPQDFTKVYKPSSNGVPT